MPKSVIFLTAFTDIYFIFHLKLNPFAIIGFDSGLIKWQMMFFYVTVNNMF